jgi:hypothetical protein
VDHHRLPVIRVERHDPVRGVRIRGRVLVRPRPVTSKGQLHSGSNGAATPVAGAAIRSARAAKIARVSKLAIKFIGRFISAAA